MKRVRITLVAAVVVGLASVSWASQLYTLPLSIGARAYNSTAETIVLNTVTALALNSERYDTNAMHDTAVNNSRLTINVPGVFSCSAHIVWSVSTANFPDSIYSYVAIRLNGSTVLAEESFSRTGGGVDNLTDYAQSVATSYQFAATNYVEAIVFHNNSENNPMDIASSGNYSPELVCQKVD